MPSQIDPTVPVEGSPTTASVRSNFATARQEMTDVQARTEGAPFLRLAGGYMAGPMYLFNDPTDLMMPATKGYVDARGGPGGGGGIPEAPSTGATFGRMSGSWQPVLPISGGELTGTLTLDTDPEQPRDAATRRYVDAGVATRLSTAGGELTGPLILADDPEQPLEPTTKRYVDGARDLLAPKAAPVFTGLVRMTGARATIEGPAGNASLTLRATGTNVNFGLFNDAGNLGLGRADPITGALVGNYFLSAPATTGRLAIQNGADIRGVVDGSEAPTGFVGEALNGSGGPFNIASGQGATPCSLTLTPGDWDVTGFFNAGAVDGSLLNSFWAGIVLDTPNTTNGAHFALNIGQVYGGQYSIGMGRVVVTSTRALYLNCLVVSSTGSTISMSGSLYARRMR